MKVNDRTNWHGAVFNPCSRPAPWPTPDPVVHILRKDPVQSEKFLPQAKHWSSPLTCLTNLRSEHMSQMPWPVKRHEQHNQSRWNTPKHKWCQWHRTFNEKESWKPCSIIILDRNAKKCLQMALMSTLQRLHSQDSLCFFRFHLRNSKSTLAPKTYVSQTKNL